MNIKHIPLVFLVGGLLTKTMLVCLSHLVQSPVLITVLTDCDPGAFAFANWGSSLFFEERRFAPGPGEAQIFEILLILGFGIECLAFGFLLRWISKHRRKVAA